MKYLFILIAFLVALSPNAFAQKWKILRIDPQPADGGAFTPTPFQPLNWNSDFLYLNDTLLVFADNIKCLIVRPDTVFIDTVQKYIPYLTDTSGAPFINDNGSKSFIYQKGPFNNYYYSDERHTYPIDTIKFLNDDKYYNFVDSMYYLGSAFLYSLEHSSNWLKFPNEYSAEHKELYFAKIEQNKFIVKFKIRRKLLMPSKLNDRPIMITDDSKNVWVAYSDTVVIYKNDGTLLGYNVEDLELNKTQNSYYICSFTKCKDGVAYATNVGDIYTYDQKTNNWSLDSTFYPEIEDLPCNYNYPYLCSNSKGELYFMMNKDYRKIFKREAKGKWKHIEVPELPLENDYFNYKIIFTKEDKMIIVSPNNVSIEL
jgi:hypothetical protein